MWGGYGGVLVLAGGRVASRCSKPDPCPRPIKVSSTGFIFEAYEWGLTVKMPPNVRPLPHLLYISICYAG